jgi:phosphate transport system substrate-binding protein
MSLRAALRIVGAGLIAAVAASSPALAQTLRIGGTGAVNAVLGQLAPAFKADTGLTLDVIAGLGTSGAINAVADGKLDLAVAGRDSRETEKTRGLRMAANFRTPIGLATSRAGPDDVKSREIAYLYRIARPVWPDGTPVLITLRPADESDNIVLAALFPGLGDALQQLRKRRDLSIAPTDQDNADVAERVKGSLISATLTQILAENRNLRFVSIDGVPASLENYLSGSYPYGKSLYVVVPPGPSPQARAFLRFLASPAAQAVLRKNAIVGGP